MPILTVPYRFRGPSRSANGGYMCGRVAGYVDGPATVTLHRPPPLDTPMTVDPDGGGGSVRVWHDGVLVADATPGGDGAALQLPGTVSIGEARMAQGRSGYFVDPVFPGCFGCGVSRQPGDGLRIFPGPVPGRPVWAAPWTPDDSLADGGSRVHPEIVWAALDCPSGIAAGEAVDLGQETALVLGRMTARLGKPPAVGDECRVIAWPIGRDGRKLTAGSVLLGPDDEVLAEARAVWLTVPKATAEKVAS
jgi:hypothetical protein